MSSELTGLSFKIRKPSAPASSSSLSTPESLPPSIPKATQFTPSLNGSRPAASGSSRRARRPRIVSSDEDSDADAPRSSSVQRTPAADASESEYEDDVDVDSVDRTPALLTRASSSSRKPAVARRAIINSAKASDKTTASEKPIVAKDERTNKSATSALKRSRAEADDGAGTASTSKGTNEPDATEPVVKKPKLPSMRKKSQAGNASVPVPKAPITAPVPPARPPAPKPKSTEVDLNNQDEYNKLFGISGSSTPNAAKKSAPVTTSSTNYKTAEQKAREIAAARERANIEREQEWLANNTFDLQASGDRIRAYETKLWEERRYMYMSQVASAWIVLPPAPVDTIPPQPPVLAQSSPPKTSQSNGHGMKAQAVNDPESL
ncbi:hypothetical protein BS47DRAFT_1381910 [Hydnum rufescens UP504]|uniref:Uncharacterized protein n=1 Tax=Hydnum rufescens UP504 TaxID=1448309 RepID=A0A9P6AZD6_9AGAM|nr:hypothetical protein BS47DRAFT_1381910 [Hydnum rufescens UP504]